MANFRLNTLENINSALAAFKNNKDVRPAVFYSRILEDTIKVPVEDYVHVQHATQTRTLPQGHQKLNLRRLGSWTPHTEVLKEGMPPRPDVTKSESIELGYTQFGRFAYFTDQIRTDVLDDFVAHYTKELSDLANRTIEKFAREKLLSAPSAYIAGGRDSIGKLLPGDIITIADLRFMTKKFERNLIKPINGNFNYICSPEFMHDLIDDPYVENYMRINQSTFNMYTNEEPFPLFKIKFYVTRLDENLAPDIDHPGEYINSDGNYELRMIDPTLTKVFSVVATKDTAVDNEEDVDSTYLSSNLAIRAPLKKYYYKDGSAIENRIFWKMNPSATVSLGTNVKNLFIKTAGKWQAVESLDAGNPELTAEEIAASVELPINRGILTGAEGLVKLTVEGQGATQIIIKELGSAGTADPLNQLSSIGFKIQGLGFGFLRPEAVYVTYSLPHTAMAMLGLTKDAILGKVSSHVDEKGTPNYSDNPEGLGLEKNFYRDSKFNERYTNVEEQDPQPVFWFVTYVAKDHEGADIVIPKQYVEDGGLAVPPAVNNGATPAKVAEGWYTDPTTQTSATKWDFETDVVNEAVTLYVKWAS